MDKIIFMQSTNFEFLRDGNETLANLGGLAEAVLHIDAGSALTRLRSFAEEVTKSIYEAEGLPRVPQASFYEMTKDSVFRHCVDSSLIHHIGYLRVKGNEAAHGAEGDKRNAIQALETAYQIAMYMGLKYYGKRKTDIVAFQPIKDLSAELKELKQTVSQYQMTLEAKAEEVDKLIDALDAERAKAAENIAVPTGEVQLAKQQASQSTAQSLQWDEAKTRALLIDALLQQAGWGVTDSNQVSVEFELQFADNSSGKGYADYVLWGDNGQPLAVVEAKRSSQKNLQAGREQARLYADALEKMGYDRPVVFYTNGYETFIWDDQQYNTYRPIYGFYSKDSLEYLIYQRQFRQADLEQFNPDVAIAGRPYQIEAIKTIAHHFQQQRRKGLIVQATGTGKTRVAIAISELLLRTGWGKRVLFLCDRKELRAQADDAFKEFLPSEPRCVIGETNQIDQNVRIYVSTYPGMMNRFAQLDVGFFDLIVADESHRTIYNKYRDLFDYFDALQLGLTATPVKYISRNTFDIFDCESTDPTFEFGLDAAINNEPPYLVPFKVKDLTTEFLRDGIHYNDLDDDQKKRLEANNDQRQGYWSQDF
jgi:type I restriction enzyme R subunit